MPDVITLATNGFPHNHPFSPSADFPGTDQIYVGSVQTIGSHDGYSGASQRINGPALFSLDYSSLIGPGQTLVTLTLGIAADDFQFPGIGNPFTATINGTVNTVGNQLDALNETGTVEHLLTSCFSPSIDNPSHILTLSIDEGGDGGDGYAVDFLTIGVTTAPAGVTPEPSTLPLFILGIGVFLVLALRRHWH